MKDEKPFNWSKDFIEHLRTVHFALAAVSLALIIAISAQDRRLPIALRQIEQIARFEKQWPTVQSRLYDLAGGPQSWEIFLKVDSALVEPNTFRFHAFIPKDKLVQWQGSTSLFKPWPTELTTLADFTRFWDGLVKGIDVYFPLPPFPPASCTSRTITVLMLGEEEGSRGTCVVEAASVSHFKEVPRTVVPGASIESTPSFEQYKNQVVLSFTLEVPQAGFRVVSTLQQNARLKIYSDVALTAWKVHVTQDKFAKVFFKEWEKGTFAQAFPELNAEASDFATVDLADTIARVQSQATTASNSISLLGLTIPLLQLTRWGPLVLFATQIYFWLHLHELVRKIEPDADGWDVAWIGIYRTTPAFIVALFSACLLPAVAAICLGVTFVTSHYYSGGVAVTGCSLIIITGVLLSALTAARLFRLRGMVEAEDL